MNELSNVEHLKNFLKHSGLRPKDYLGQNFLVDEDALRAIVAAAEIKPNDTVLEVGPGLGVLTEELVAKAGSVIAVEKDEKLVSILRDTFRGGASRIGTRHASNVTEDDNRKTIRAALPNNAFTLFNEDILRFNLDQHISGPYKVVANIPYYLTSYLFQYFLSQKNQPKLIVLMVQKEVGERVVAGAGDLSVLGISVQIQADAEIVRKVSKEGFWPVPKVDSVILKITPRKKYPEIVDEKLFFSMIKTAFAGKRKQIKNTLKNVKALQAAGIDPSSRPQDLSIKDWIRLYRTIVDNYKNEV